MRAAWTAMMGRMDFTPATAAAYLSAMVDGEGCVELRQRATGTWRRRVRISNTSVGIVRAIQDACSVLGLHYTLHERAGTNKPSWEFNFPGSEIPKLAEVLTLADAGKAERLARAATYRVVWERDAAGRLVTSKVVWV